MAEKKYTIVTVDNGWGISEFIRVTANFENTRRIVMQKGAVGVTPRDGVEFVPYDESLDLLIREADVALFSRIGIANKSDYLKLVKAGVAVVVRDGFSQDVVEHQKTGWLFSNEQWAMHWLAYLRDNPKERERLRESARMGNEYESLVDGVQSLDELKPECRSVKVTVITPTYHRDPQVVRRCIDCMLLQTEKDWEQIVCSDGENEQGIARLVDGIGDRRVRYCYTTTKKECDFGNTVRAEMMKQAKGEYVLFFDDDNLILPDFLEKMVEAIKKSDADFCVCKIIHFGPLNEGVLGKPPKVLTGDPVKLYHIDALQVLVRREVIQKIGWDTSVGYLSDGVTLEKLSSYKCVRVDQVLGIHM